jgi:hypothetical protein
VSDSIPIVCQIHVPVEVIGHVTRYQMQQVTQINVNPCPRCDREAQAAINAARQTEGVAVARADAADRYRELARALAVAIQDMTEE